MKRVNIFMIILVFVVLIVSMIFLGMFIIGKASKFQKKSQPQDINEVIRKHEEKNKEEIERIMRILKETEEKEKK